MMPSSLVKCAPLLLSSFLFESTTSSTKTKTLARPPHHRAVVDSRRATPSSSTGFRGASFEEEEEEGGEEERISRRRRRRGRRRRAQSLFDVDDDVVDDERPSRPSIIDYEEEEEGEEEEEWYLPDSTTTWLFGSGDPAEWGGAAAVGVRPAPVAVPGLRGGEHAIGISAGSTHSALLTSDGRVFTAGGGGECLGRRWIGNETASTSSPLGFAPVTEFFVRGNNGTSAASATTMVAAPFIAKVVASDGYTVAIDADGNVWSTGSNDRGQLCLNDTVSRDAFHMVTMMPAAAKVADVVLGVRHTLLLADDGTAYGCGWNEYGQLGTGSGGADATGPTRIVVVPDEEDDVPDDDDDDDDGASGEIAVATTTTTTDGTGSATTTTTTTTTTSVGNATGEAVVVVVVGVAAGRGSSYFLTSSGRVYAAGTNYRGQLCLGHRRDRTLPTLLSTVIDYLDGASVDGDFSLSDEGVAVASVTASDSSVYLLLTNGAVLACGENSRGQLGIGREDGDDDDDDDDDDAFGSVDVPVPVLAGGLANAVTAVYTGPTSHGAILVDGRSGAIRAVGYGGSDGASGEGWIVPAALTACAGDDDGDDSVPATIAASRSGSTDGGRVVAIAIGNDHALFLASAGTSFDCGDDAPTASPGPTAAPTTTPSPTTSPGPTAAPTTSPSPTASIFPTFIPPDGGGSTGPTTASALPLAFDAPAPPVPTEMQTKNAAHGRLRYSSKGGFVSCLFLGVALSPIIWHWF